MSSYYYKPRDLSLNLHKNKTDFLWLPFSPLPVIQKKPKKQKVGSSSVLLTIKLCIN